MIYDTNMLCIIRYKYIPFSISLDYMLYIICIHVDMLYLNKKKKKKKSNSKECRTK